MRPRRRTWRWRRAGRGASAPGGGPWPDPCGILPGSWPEPSGKLAGSFREAGGNLAGRFEAGFARQCEARTEWAMATGLSENLDFASLGPGETSRALVASVEAGMNSPGGLFPGMKTRLAPSPVGRWIKTLAGNRALPRLLSSPGAIKRVAWGWGGGGRRAGSPDDASVRGLLCWRDLGAKITQCPNA